MKNKFWNWGFLLLLLQASTAHAGEADIKLPDLGTVRFQLFGGTVPGLWLMYAGLVVCLFGAAFGLWQYVQTKNLSVHQRMRQVSNIIWETCKTYLLQQGKFLAMLWALIAVCIGYYFLGLQEAPIGNVIVVLVCSVLGILGSYGVAWFGIRINTQANSRTAFSALRGNPLATLSIPLRSGMSVGLAAGQCGTFLHDLHPLLSSQGPGGTMLHRICHW